MEALQKMSDPVLVDCPACNAPALRKQLTAAAFKLKGSGWYETDFKNSGKPAADGSAEKSSSESAKETTASDQASTADSSTSSSSTASASSAV